MTLPVELGVSRQMRRALGQLTLDFNGFRVSSVSCSFILKTRSRQVIFLNLIPTLLYNSHTRIWHGSFACRLVGVHRLVSPPIADGVGGSENAR